MIPQFIIKVFKSIRIKWKKNNKLTFISSILRKTFSKQHLLSLAIMMPLGLVGRWYINECLDVNVFTQYTEPVSIAFYSFMFMFKAFINELFNGHYLMKIPQPLGSDLPSPSESNSCKMEGNDNNDDRSSQDSFDYDKFMEELEVTSLGSEDPDLKSIKDDKQEATKDLANLDARNDKNRKALKRPSALYSEEKNYLEAELAVNEQAAKETSDLVGEIIDKESRTIKKLNVAEKKIILKQQEKKIAEDSGDNVRRDQLSSEIQRQERLVEAKDDHSPQDEE